MLDKNKIILFPNMKESWIEKSFQSIEDEDFNEALHYINKLIEHGATDFDVLVGKIICHIQLGQSVDAELYCEELLEDKNGPYFYDILFYYVSILFDSNKYAKLIHYIDELEESIDVPEFEKSKYKELYDMCLVMNDNVAKNVLQEVEEQIAQNNFYQAYVLLQKWDRLRVELPASFENMLLDDSIHVVLKTYILKMLRNRNVNREIKMRKFNELITVIPSTLKPVTLSETYQLVDEQLHDIEQENPVLYTLLIELLEHFLFVYYPKSFTDHIDEITEALIILGEQNFLQSIDEEKMKASNPFMLKIMQAQQQYLEIISH